MSMAHPVTVAVLPESTQSRSVVVPLLMERAPPACRGGYNCAASAQWCGDVQERRVRGGCGLARCGRGAVARRRAAPYQRGCSRACSRSAWLGLCSSRWRRHPVEGEDCAASAQRRGRQERKGRVA